jgi:hypothetical protein
VVSDKGASFGRRVMAFLWTPKGVLALILSVFVTAIAVGSGTSGTAAPALLVGCFFVVWALLWVIQHVWESNTWPKAPPYVRRPASDQMGMLRRDGNAHFFRDHGGFLFAGRYFFVGTCCPPVQVRRDRFLEVRRRQTTEPVAVVTRGHRTWWHFEDQFYWDNESHGARDVLALIRDRERKAGKKLERAHVLMNLDQNPQPRRVPIPKEVRKAVFDREGGRCVECGSTFDLQYDHILPFALGGATTVENLQLLCSTCNQEKSDSL